LTIPVKLSDHQQWFPFDELMDSHYTDSPTLSPSTMSLSGHSPSAQPMQCEDRRNLIIWDWDDTIFPTFCFKTNQWRRDNLFMSKLRTLVSFTEEAFESMITLYGADCVVIVTNGSSEWIQKCLNEDVITSVYDCFQKLLQKHNIKTISASTEAITKLHPDDPQKWKEVVFRRLFDQHFGDSDLGDGVKNVHCITSIGDSLCEFNASDTASKWMEHRVLNRLRLRPNPTVDVMIKQMKTVVSMVRDFGSTTDGIELDLASSQ
jgi:hypothetical protein